MKISIDFGLWFYILISMRACIPQDSSDMASILRAAHRAFSSRLSSSITGVPSRLYSTESKASDLKVGTFIEHESKFWQVHSITRSAQGAQRSVLIMTELKEFKSGRKDNVRFDQDDPISGMDGLPCESKSTAV